MAASTDRSSAGERPLGAGAGSAGEEASAAPAARRAGRMPDFFVVGHEKCGTTALDLMLKSHPQIFMPQIKEQRFFAPELRGGMRNPRSRDGGRPRRLEDYLALFAAAAPEQRVGEASPQYLRSRTAAARIAAVQPAARIVAILREPASFLRSFHLQWVQNRVETERDLRKAIALEPERREGRRIPRGRHVPETLFYSDHVHYVEQLERYRAVFPREQLLVLIYDDFRRDNVETVRRVLRFLEVDPDAPLEPVETRPLKAVRSPLLKHVADSARAARRNPVTASALGRTVNRITPAALRSEAFRARWRRVVYKAPDPPDEAFMRELRRRFKPEVVALSEYLGRDMVAEWGYDRID
jgi:Sulfotransferase family